jgi:hypothetical protein
MNMAPVFDQPALLRQNQFVSLIRASGINASLLHLHWSCKPDQETAVVDTMNIAQATIRQILGRTIPSTRTAFRAGRPCIWLLIASGTALTDKKGSANSMVGLHCTFFAAHVWQSHFQNHLNTGLKNE